MDLFPDWTKEKIEYEVAKHEELKRLEKRNRKREKKLLWLSGIISRVLKDKGRLRKEGKNYLFYPLYGPAINLGRNFEEISFKFRFQACQFH